MNQYNCPYCAANLNVNGNVVLSFKRKQGKSGLLLLSDELGDYTVHHSPELKFEDKEKLHFHCPCCSKSLEYKKGKNLVRIIKVDTNGEEHTVIFSAKFGEKMTYQISEERQLSFGEHAIKYLDPLWYTKN